MTAPRVGVAGERDRHQRCGRSGSAALREGGCAKSAGQDGGSDGFRTKHGQELLGDSLLEGAHLSQILGRDGRRRVTAGRRSGGRHRHLCGFRGLEQVARHERARRRPFDDGPQLGRHAAADVHDVRAARREAAAARDVDRRRDLARDRRSVARSRSVRGSGCGIRRDERSACTDAAGVKYTSSAAPISTSEPKYMTAMRSET